MSALGKGLVTLSLSALLLSPNVTYAKQNVSKPKQNTTKSVKPAPKPQARDLEFLDIYTRTKDLEKSLLQLPRDSEDRVFPVSYKNSNGETETTMISGGPATMNHKIYSALEEKINKLASRYGVTFDKNWTTVATSGEFLVVEDLMQKELATYFIFRPFSMTLSKIGTSNGYLKDHFYSYQTTNSFLNGNRFNIVAEPEIANGPVQILESNDFTGLRRKILELSGDAKKERRSVGLSELPDGSNTNDNELKWRFSIDQRGIIREFVWKLFDNVEGLYGATHPKELHHLDVYVPRDGSRIILNGTYGLNGNMSLSISGNGRVSYTANHWIDTESYVNLYRDLKIEFPEK